MKIKLRDILEINYGKDIKNLNKQVGKIPVYGSGGIVGYTDDFIYNKESVLIARVGTLDKPLYVNKPFWTINTMFFLTPKSNDVLIRYVYYFMTTINLDIFSEGTSVPRLTRELIYNISISIPDLQTQQHIVNTISSVDDLIEKYEIFDSLIHKLANTKIDQISNKNSKTKMSDFCSFEKGKEVGSANYQEQKTENNIPFYRVSDLNDNKSVFIDKELEYKTVSADDVLISFDGSPGRMGLAFEGAYSSGLYKINCDKEILGKIYFELKHEINQQIIKNYSQGTTILHASKSISFLETFNVTKEEELFFKKLLEILINLRLIIKKLNQIKTTLLSKYF